MKTVPDAHAGWGIPITRQKTEYEKTSYFKQDGYPAPRPWYPLPGNLSHEIVPTLRAGYVYDHLGALFIHRHSLVDSTPGGRRLADVLGDQDKINLLVSFDVEIGDTSRFADFVLPDKVYLERFSQESIYPNQQYQLIQLGQPAVRAFDGPRSVEDVYFDIMQRLGLPGVGEHAVPVGKDGDGGTAALSTEYDYWLKMAANIAYAGEKPVPDADDELALFERARKRALGEAFDLEAWKAAVTEEEWPKVVYVLNRGGRFASADPAKGDGYDGDLIKTKYAGLCAFYDPKTASLKDALTGENFDGLAHTAPIAFADGTPWPGGPIHLIASTGYCNFLICNGVVIGQRYWHEGMDPAIKGKDEAAQAVLEECFPDRTVVMVDSLALNMTGGGVHCWTKNVAASEPR